MANGKGTSYMPMFGVGNKNAPGRDRLGRKLAAPAAPARPQSANMKKFLAAKAAKDISAQNANGLMLLPEEQAEYADAERLKRRQKVGPVGRGKRGSKELHIGQPTLAGTIQGRPQSANMKAFLAAKEKKAKEKQGQRDRRDLSI